MLIEKIFAFLFSSDQDEQKTQKVEVEVKPKPIVIKSCYLLGKGFFVFHNDAKPKEFVKWLKEYQADWYKNNSEIIKALNKSTILEQVEVLYGLKASNHSEYETLKLFFRKWYVQEHGVFRFSTFDRAFLSVSDSHLLQVLYEVNDEEIIIVDDASKVETVISSPEDYKNNWFIGADSNDVVVKAVAKCLIENCDIHLAHYKLINDDTSKNAGFIELLKAKGITNYIEPQFNSVTTIPNDVPTKLRFQRYDQFNSFAEKAENTFKHFLADTPKAKRFDDIYMLNIWNDRNHPKNYVTYVNVAFGSRPLTVSHHNKGFTSTVEEGARLCFYRMETGHVSVTLYPAKTDGRKPIEDCIILKQSIDPKVLANEKKLKNYWNNLVAYMECTSVDGAASYWQKRHVKHLRYSYHAIVDNVIQPTKRQESWNKIKDFVISVGLSGSILYLIQITYNYFNPDTTQEQYKNEVIQHIDSLQDAVRQTSVEFKTVIESQSQNNDTSQVN